MSNIILKLISKKEDVKVWTGFNSLRIGSSGESFVKTVINLWVP
jgi:hypothetical protein